MKNRRGFTLMELLVTILIIGILTAFAVPSYMKALETGRAEDAASLARMVATTNRMYALDTGSFVSGAITDACNSASCATATNACKLVACKYLAAQHWSAKGYDVHAGNGGSASTSCSSLVSGLASKNWAGCVKRKAGASAPYVNWGYGVATDGTVQAVGGAPDPAQ